ncbi:hypothetical protein L2X98_27940 [Microbacterium elymi]|uniref:HTH araC/xylS-type domain-containing protein n=1 Tax=Microbacterium elymi TaxID=2909587 RepID=A0ABY5NH44_9MICO|nr:hypothetical protein [Microbacterium elymi]UUT34431.1 hypothetical protein L2X98_27940 [Microbacterium elymi]
MVKAAKSDGAGEIALESGYRSYKTQAEFLRAAGPDAGDGEGRPGQRAPRVQRAPVRARG